jgi:DNA-binding response OmpR family regulator
MTEILQQQGYNIIGAATGAEAIAKLGEVAGRIDAMILDREMPGMSGLEVVGKMKNDSRFAGIPIIMLTGTGEPDRIQEGIDAGVFYYLVKPADNILLRSVIDSALRERRQKSALVSQLFHQEAALRAMRGCQLAVRTLTEAENTATFLASCFPDPERAVTGLMELLVNAVEHGTFGVTYEEKQQLLLENEWRREVDRRASLPENAGRTVDVIFQRKDGSCLVQITDPGPGFEWKRFWHINPARATASHGRGIARARLMAFDRLAYNDAGNQVTVMMSENVSSTQSYAW